MSLSTTAGYSWTSPSTVTAAKLALAATPTVPDNQTYLFALGSASLPSMGFYGYPNTGIYSPGADQVAIACGGALKALFNSTGNVLTAGSISGQTLIAAASGGVFKLGNARQAGAPTCDGYVTIQDSTGTTYKIPCLAA